MDFQLTEEQTLLRDMARDFAEAELKPRAAKHDKQESLDPEVVAQMSELGLMGLTIAEQYGGAGMGNLELVIVLEEINRGCAATGVTLSVHNSLTGSPITKWGSEEQKAEWLPKLASGEIIGAYALTEAGSGSDAAALSTKAERDGDDWILNGTKIWVTSGSMAGLVIVYARTDPSLSNSKGISAFLVDMTLDGCNVGKHEKKVGIRGSPAVELEFVDCRVPARQLLGELNRGFPIALDTLDGGRIGIAAQSVGIGLACLEAALEYSSVRKQFGRTINAFQAIQWKLADMSTRIDAARMLTHKAAWLRDRGEPCGRAAAQAKLLASTMANYCADESLQIHGGAGYTDHFEIERLFRDARITEIYEGATDIQRLVIARSLIMQGA